MLLVEDPPVDLATPTGPMRTYLYRPLLAVGTRGHERSAGGARSAPEGERGHERSAGGARSAPEGERGSIERYPGIVLYSEIFQRTAPVHRMAMLLAGHGFVVALPEIFHAHEAAGAVLAYDDAGTARGNAHKAATAPAAHDADARAVLDHLAASPHCTGALGAMGVCIGGHLAFRAALQPDVRAAACFYATNLHDASLGGGDDSLARAQEIRGELMMVWGRQDPHVPDPGRAAIRQRLLDAGASFTWHEHDAQHAFLRDEGRRYDPALALASYAQVVALFQRTLA